MPNSSMSRHHCPQCRRINKLQDCLKKGHMIKCDTHGTVFPARAKCVKCIRGERQGSSSKGENDGEDDEENSKNRAAGKAEEKRGGKRGKGKAGVGGYRGGGKRCKERRRPGDA